MKYNILQIDENIFAAERVEYMRNQRIISKQVEQTPKARTVTMVFSYRSLEYDGYGMKNFRKITRTANFTGCI